MKKYLFVPLMLSNTLYGQWVLTEFDSVGVDCITVNFYGTGGTRIIAGTRSAGIFFSTDNGVHWETRNSGLPKTSFDTSHYENVTALAVFGSIYFGSLSGFNGGMFFSTNQGISWTKSNTLHGFRCIVTIDTNLYAARGWPDIFRSSDNGLMWETIAKGWEGTRVMSLAVKSKASGGTNLYAGIQDIGVYLSTNNGTTWSAKGNVDHYDSFSLTVFGDYLFALSDISGVYRSLNNGETWDAVNSGLNNTWIWSHVVHGQHFFVGTDSGVFVSTNYGTQWINVSNGLFEGISPVTLRRIYALAATDSFLFAATEVGIWKRQLSDMITSVGKNGNTIPRQFEIHQNYPNPFNPSTTIRYALPTSAHVTLTVHDVLGREITTLVNEEQIAGWKEIEWNASGFASGMYAVRMQSGSFVETKKMVLMK